jgi:hypothetical protein
VKLTDAMAVFLNKTEDNMESTTIAALVKFFNVASICVLGWFAVFGVAAFFVKRLRVSAALLAFCAAALAAFALETTAFNFPRYLRYFAGPPTATVGLSETGPGTVKTTDGATAINDGKEIRFSGLDRKVTSVFVDLKFEDVETAEIVVQWEDESSTYAYKKTLYKELPYENYAVIQPCGKVSDVTIKFGDNFPVKIVDVAINKPIPFYFSGLRLLAVSCLLFALLSLLNKNLRAKAAYYLFEYKFDAKNGKQNIAYACTVALLLLYSWVCVYTSGSVAAQRDTPGEQYNRFLVDALIAGKTYLDVGNPQKLLLAERPYDTRYLNEHGYVSGVDYMGDFSYYKGRHYSYFGVVPAVLLYVPYKMITGGYLSNHAGVFVFGAVAVILLASLWRHCVNKYMPEMRYALYLFSWLAVFFASCLSHQLRFPFVYSIARTSGFMFAAAGILLLLKSVNNEKISLRRLFFGCLCLALVFGCSPSMGLASLLVPVVLWRHRSWKLLLFVMIPYILVAIPLCWYNYVRFESIFDFGAQYNLTSFNMVAYMRQNALGKFIRIFICFAVYLFYPVNFSLDFPFVHIITGSSERISLGVMIYCYRYCGIINFPIVFCLIYLFKNMYASLKSFSGTPKIFLGLSASLIIGAAIICLDSYIVGVTVRYMTDFMSFFVFPSLFCAYYWCHRDTSSVYRKRLAAAYALIAVTVFVGLFMCVDSEWAQLRDPALYRYLKYSLGIISFA